MKRKMPGVPAPPDDEPNYTQPISDKPQNIGDVIRKLHDNTKRSIRPNPKLKKGL